MKIVPDWTTGKISARNTVQIQPPLSSNAIFCKELAVKENFFQSKLCTLFFSTQMKISQDVELYQILILILQILGKFILAASKENNHLTASFKFDHLYCGTQRKGKLFTI